MLNLPRIGRKGSSGLSARPLVESPYRLRMMLYSHSVSKIDGVSRANGKYHGDAKMVNDKRKWREPDPRRKAEDYGGELAPCSDIQRLFTLMKCGPDGSDRGACNEEMVREFYASYLATLRGSI
ncbi:hypothetical protein H5410_002106 [Solanum commersonii]|uniref:Uncharacterized protein n=1 Tax=Solanum commersonii TaxID=4109 RepID=A0A9J6B0Q5_SOLCO|nr:hypothetical protein H5410_002106 [Solanum commersonii]